MSSLKGYLSHMGLFVGDLGEMAGCLRSWIQLGISQGSDEEEQKKVMIKAAMIQIRALLKQPDEQMEREKSQNSFGFTIKSK